MRYCFDMLFLPFMLPVVVVAVLLPDAVLNVLVVALRLDVRNGAGRPRPRRRGPLLATVSVAVLSES